MQCSQNVCYVLAILLVLVFGVLATTYSIVTPMWEAPDEVGHFDFIVHLLTTGTLPEQRIGRLGQAHQPPLYYVVAAGLASLADFSNTIGSFHPNPDFIWAGGDQPNISLHTAEEKFPFRGRVLAFHLARGASVLMGMMTVALTIAIGWLVFPHAPGVGLMAAALVALNPQFLFISSSINNDNLLVATSTGLLWQTLQVIKKPDQAREWLFVGIWLAVAMLAKLSSFAIGFLVGLVLVDCAIRRRSLKLLVRGTLILSVVVALLTGWWFVRNQILYGDPLGWKVFEEVFTVVLRTEPLRAEELITFFDVQFKSYWGVFGWMSVIAPSWFYNFVKLVLGLSFLGVGLLVVGGWFRELSEYQKLALIILVLAVVIQEAYMLVAITRFNPSWYQGRYLFPVIAPAMTIVSLGLVKIVSIFPQRSHLFVSGGFVLVLIVIALFMCFWVIAPAYAAGISNLTSQNVCAIVNK